jgi:hypothetical protein
VAIGIGQLKNSSFHALVRAGFTRITDPEYSPHGLSFFRSPLCTMQIKPSRLSHRIGFANSDNFPLARLV